MESFSCNEGRYADSKDDTGGDREKEGYWKEGE